MSAIINYLGDNAVQIDAEEGAKILQKECPELLQNGESVVMAFKDRGGKGRDDSFLTSHRLIIRDRKSWMSGKTAYQSIPYKSIEAFSVTTAGSVDADVEMAIYAPGVGKTTMEFVKKVDLMEIKNFLSTKVLGKGNYQGESGLASETVEAGKSSSMGFLEAIGLDDNGRQIDPTELEKKLKGRGILVDDEKVELAFRFRRDSFVFTNKRIIDIDVQGVSGKRVKYKSILWDRIAGFSLESAGSFDRDYDGVIFTDIADMPRIEFDLRKGKADLHQVMRYLGEKLLTPGYVPNWTESGPDSDGHVGVHSGKGSFFSFLSNNNALIDPVEMNAVFHSDPPILIPTEKVDLAFRGRRDYLILTNKRMLIVDTRGFTGKRVRYTSVPWKTIRMFGVRSAGSIDTDSEILIWTDVNDGKPGSDDQPPIPRNSYFEMDVKKKEDILMIKRYLSERCLHAKDGNPNELPDFSTNLSSSSGGLSSFFDWIGQNAKQVDSEKLNHQLHTATPVLQQDERVLLGYQEVRDSIVFTTKRMLIIDKKGFTGKRVEWVSVPYSSIRSFAVETAGSFDRDVELKLWLKTYWTRDDNIGWKIKQDFRKGHANIFEIESLLASQVLRKADGTAQHANYDSMMSMVQTTQKSPESFSFKSWITQDGVNLDPSLVDEKLRGNPKILQDDEVVDSAYKVGRDMCVFTNKRLLKVDVQGMTGKRVEYQTIPLEYCTAFMLQSHGTVGVVSPPMFKIYFDIPGVWSVKQDLKKGASDIWVIHKLLATKVAHLF